MNPRLFKLCVVIAALAVFLCTQAQAANRHQHIAVISQGSASPDLGPAPAANLYGIAAYFSQTPLNAEVCTTSGCTNENPFNGPYPGTDTSVAAPNDFWPCFGDNTAQPDCLYIGPSAGYTYPSGATSLPTSVVLGSPAYTWYLSANTASDQTYGCDATATADTFHMCTQAINFYEDDSGDSTDELIWSIEVTQGTSIIYDSGIQDYGVNPYGALTAPTIVFYEDLVFGIPNGGAVNNDGPCFQSYNYPSNTAGPGGNYQGLANTFGGVFGITPKKTCVAPKAGAATVTITTELAKPTWKGVTVKADCPASTMDGPPNATSPYCYTVTYTKVKELSQKFTIWFR